MMADQQLEANSIATAAFQKDDVLETLRCAICNCYLSVPPILIISEDGQNQKCGRCKDVISEINQRNSLLENLMKLLTFPCIFKNCKEKIAWGEVEEHEKLCFFKIIKCPLYLVCNSDLRVSEVISHFVAEHKNSVFYDTYEDKHFGNDTQALLIKNSMPFILYHGINKADTKRPNTISLSVYSLMPELDYKYSVKIKVKPKVSLLFKNQVSLFDERKHCLVCVAGQCTEKHHKLVETTRGCDGDGTIRFDPQPLRADVFKCTVILKNQKESCKRKSFAESDETSCSHEKLVRKAIQCPICFNYMEAPVYSCETGHLLCAACRATLSKCPTCQTELENSRCYAIEEMAEEVRLSCEQCEHENCNFIGNVHELREHHARKKLNDGK